MKATWPMTKFRVRMARGTAAGWVNVEWTDGPDHLHVMALLSMFESSQHEAPACEGASPWRICAGEAHWVREGIVTSREISQDAREKVQRENVRQADDGTFYGMIDTPKGPRIIPAPSQWTTAESVAARVARDLSFQS
nr:LPD29 domain-containing protein [Micrococcus cohnii]